MGSQFIHPVFHHENGHVVLLIQTMKKGEKILHSLRIHLTHRLVKNEELWMGNENGCQGQPLPLSSGKSMNAPVLHARKAHLL